MNCNHINPAGYVYCGTCGAVLAHVRCRCGFVAGIGDIFCGRCGINLLEGAAGDGRAVVDADHRFDLERLVQQAAQEKQFLESTDKARVTQDDIRKLLTMRKRKF
ncbi:MAG: zinc ribbon domain-containing protein [Gallionellaceae bacterium]|nr:zinc ribbon domain-containing protein [Gallionellaceae bacterium]